MKAISTSIAVSLLLFFSISTALSQGITLELVKGNSISAQAYTAPIPVTSAQYSFSNSTTIGSVSSGSGGGRATFAPFVITKQLDGSTAVLQQSLFTGGHYQYVRVNFYRADGSLGYRVVLGTVFTVNYSASAAEGCTSGCPALSESITFQYGQVATYDPTGAGRITSWDQVANRENVSTVIPTSVITQ